MWGQVVKISFVTQKCGIIPTRVGTRSGVLVSGKLTKDHPHACGDKISLYDVKSIG